MSSSLEAAQHVRFRIDGVTLSYTSYGEGKSMLFIHGYTDCSKFWASQLQLFSRNYRTTALDLRGHGNSDMGEKDFTLETLSRDTFSFLQRINAGSTIVIGHSMGGMVAQQLCISHPRSVRALVLCSTASSGEEMRDAGGFDCVAAEEEIKRDGFEKFVRNSARFLFARGTDQKIVDYAISEELKTNVDAAMSSLRAMWEWDARDSISRIAVPTLIVVGDQDQATPITCSRSLNKKILGSRLQILPECGHMVALEKPEELGEAIRAFLHEHFGPNESH
jgi:pimeloyl-ACP methyl ester carboxylesterase